eukprot:3534120-Prymnesium_polylepis.1
MAVTAVVLEELVAMGGNTVAVDWAEVEAAMAPTVAKAAKMALKPMIRRSTPFTLKYERAVRHDCRSRLPDIALIACSLPDDAPVTALQAQRAHVAPKHVVPPAYLRRAGLSARVAEIEHVTNPGGPARLDEHIVIAGMGGAWARAAGRCAASSACPGAGAAAGDPSDGSEVGFEA